MKLFIIHIITITMTCCTVIAQVKNAGFETGTIVPSGSNYLLDGWIFAFNSTGGEAVPAFDTEIKNSGDRSFKAIVTNPGSPQNPWNIRLDMTDDAFHSFVKDDYVEFSFHARANTTGKQISVKFRDSDNGNWITEFKILTTGFKKYTIGQIITETRNDYKLSFFLAADTGTFWIDDVSVMVISNTVNQTPAVYHVSPDGDDNNPGTEAAPFKTLEKASMVINGNDTLYLHEGVYRGGLQLDFRKGDPDNPIVIKAFPGDEVIIDGTVDITDGWELHEGGIFKRSLEQDIWGLYYNDSMMMAARWPNASIYDFNFFNQKETYRDLSNQSSLGVVYDSRPFNNELSEYYELPTDGRYGYIRPGYNTESLAETGVSMEGAVAILNIGSWMTWASAITKHTAGSNVFEYDTMFSAGGSTRNSALTWTRPRIDYLSPTETVIVDNLQKRIDQYQCHYYIEGLPCLDAPGEWWYTPEDRTLYFYPPGGQDPNGKTIKVKVKDFSIQGKYSEYIEISDIVFYATAFYFESCKNITVRNCDFLFPGHSRRVLGDYDRPGICTFNNKNEKTVTAHKLINCRFEYFDGDGVEFTGGSKNLIDNVLLHDFNFSCIGSGMAMRTSDSDTVRHVTIYNSGGAEGIQVEEGGVAEFNHIYHFGSLQHDGAGLQTFFKEAPVIYRYNWSHTTLKGGMRFDDGGGIPQPPSYSGQMDHNVSWTSRGFQIKGDSNLINNNLLFNTEGGLELMVNVKMNGINTHSITINNVADWYLSTGWNRGNAPGYMGSNIQANTDSIKKWFRDPDNWDFRPKYDDYVCEKGEEFSVCGQDLPSTGYCFNYERPIPKIGKLPDIGPYEAGSENYWIPGFRYPHASTPIPLDNGTTYSEFTDLMWLEGYQSESSDVYFGLSKTAVETATHSSDEFKGNQANNIFYPGSLQQGQAYFWRIDAVNGNKTEKGPVWSFTAGRDANPVVYRADFQIYGFKNEEILPLSYVWVSLHPRSTVTDDQGRASLEKLKPSEYGYQFKGKGYTGKSGTFQIIADTVIIDTLEYTTYELTIQVKDEDTGEPIAFCEADLDEYQYVADDQGVVHISGIEYSFYNLKFNANDYIPAVISGIEIYSDTILTVTLKRDYLQVSLTVLNRVTGELVYRAAIYYNGDIKLTNSSGVTSIDNLIKGTWVFTIEHYDYFTLTDSFEVKNDTSVIVFLTSRLATITFEISDPAGPVAGITVFMNGLRVLSNSSGEVSFYKQLARKHYGYTIEKSGYKPIRDSLYLEIDTTIAISLVPETGFTAEVMFTGVLFPNPANEKCYFRITSERATVKVINLEGKLMLVNNANKGLNELDVSVLADGVYYFHLQTTENSLYWKMVIQH